MSGGQQSTDHVRSIDLGALQTSAASGELGMQTLLGHESGARNCLVNAFLLPPDTGSPVGWHTHECEQIFFIVSGTLTFEIDGEQLLVEAGSIQITPPHVPHRNWNAGPDNVLLVSFNTPLPDPHKPIANPVAAPTQEQ